MQTKIITEEKILNNFSSLWTTYWGYIFYGLCRNIQAKTTLEVGFRGGYITIWLLRAAIENEGRHYAVDNNPRYLAQLEKKFSQVGITDYHPKFFALCKNSLEVEWGISLDFLFLDSLHDYVTVSGELRKFGDYVRIGGYIAVHDYLAQGGCQAACDEYFISKKWEKIIFPDIFSRGGPQGCGCILAKRIAK